MDEAPTYRCHCGGHAIGRVEVWADGARIATRWRCALHFSDRPVVTYIWRTDDNGQPKDR